jgi:hypothetical protein
MKGVVEPAPDLQMTVGRGQEKGLPYVMAPPPPRGRAFNFSIDTLGGKDIFPLGIGGKIDKTGLRGHLSIVEGSQCPWRGHC